MEQRKLTFLITHLILRIRDYPPDAVNELLQMLDRIERRYDLVEKLTNEEWQAVIESKDDVVRIEAGSLGLSKTSLNEEDDLATSVDKTHFDEAVKRVRMRSAEEQGDISDLLFALLDEYFLDFPI